jgi:hypothetical protein
MIGESYWHVDGQVLVVEFIGVITLEDVKESNQRISELIDSGTRESMVHLIADARQRTEIHKELRSLKNFKEASSSSDEMGWLIVVDPNPDVVLRFVVNALSQLTSQRFRVFTSFEDATDFLYEMDPTLVAPKEEEPEMSNNQQQE